MSLALRVRTPRSRLLVLALGCLGGVSLLARAGYANAPDARALLAQAEASSSGAAGRVDWPKAIALYRQAAATGDPVASGRLATLEHLGRDGVARSEAVPRDRAKAQRSARAALAGVRAAAERGEAEAQFVLGSMYLLGLGTAIDDAAALRWYAAATEQDHVWACYDLAWMRENARGGPADLAAAEVHHRNCAALGNTASMGALANLSFGALADRIPKSEASAWLRKAAERGDLYGAGWLGNVLLYGKGVPADRAEAVKWLEVASARGDTAANYDLAFAALTSPGGGDRARGALALERASKGPHAKAMVQLGWLKIVDAQSESQAREGWEWIDRAATYGLDQLAYLFGVESDGVAERRLLAGELDRLRRSADAGGASAKALLARFLFQELGEGETDPAVYLKLARSAAAAGEKHAMRLLGQAYRHGQGLEADRAVSLDWYRKGAAAGDSFCMMWLSQTLLQGKDVPADLPNGLRWLERSAEVGNYWALLDLAHLFDEGWYGLPRDPRRALELKRRLAELGDTEAIGWLRFHSPEDAP